MDSDLFNRYERALHNAAKAGDIEGARRLAGEMRLMLREQYPEAMVLPSPQEEGARLAAEETTPGEAFLMAAGREGLDKPIQGMKQAYLIAKQGLGADNPETFASATTDLANLEKQEKEKGIADAALSRAHPIASAVGSAAPYAAVPASSGVMGGAGLIALHEMSKYGTQDERLKRGATGALTAFAGGMLGDLVAKGVSPVARETLTNAKASALRTAKKIGYKVRLSEASGSRFASRVEDFAARHPLSAGVMAEHQAKNAQAMNRWVAKGIGLDAKKFSELSEDAFTTAINQTKTTFNKVDKLGKIISLPRSAANTADDILRTTKQMLPNQVDENIVKYANDLKRLVSQKAKLDAKSYQLLRSGLSDSIFDATGVNKTLYGKMLKVLDDAADSSLKMGGHAKLAEELTLARKHWGNIRVLEKGMVVEAGNVSPKRLATALRQQNPQKYKSGGMKDNPLYDVAQLGENLEFLIRGSQTFERQAFGMNPQGSLTQGAIAWPLAKATTWKPVTAYSALHARNPLLGRAMAPIGDVADQATRAALMQYSPQMRGILFGEE